MELLDSPVEMLKMKQSIDRLRTLGYALRKLPTRMYSMRETQIKRTKKTYYWTFEEGRWNKWIEGIYSINWWADTT